MRARISTPYVIDNRKDNQKNEIQEHSRDQRIKIYRSMHGPEKCPLLTPDHASCNGFNEL